MPPSRSVPPPGAIAGRATHFRAWARKPVRLTVDIVGQRSGAGRLGLDAEHTRPRQAIVVDLSLAGAGIETEEPLVAGDHISLTLVTPTLWDPLVISAVVAWSHSPRVTNEIDAFGRARSIARAGVAFDYPDPKAVLAMFQMLTALGYE